MGSTKTLNPVIAKLIKDDWYKQQPDCNLWIALLDASVKQEAVWTFQGDSYKLYPGQWVGTIQELAAMAGESRYKTLQALTRLVDSESIAKIDLNRGALITILDWETYLYQQTTIEGTPESAPEKEDIKIIPEDSPGVRPYHQYKGKYRAPMGGNLDNPIFDGIAKSSAKIIKTSMNGLGMMMSGRVEERWVHTIKSIMAELINGKAKEFNLSGPIPDYIDGMCAYIADDKELLNRYGSKPWFLDSDYPEILKQYILNKPVERTEEEMKEEQEAIARQRKADRELLERAAARKKNG